MSPSLDRQTLQASLNQYFGSIPDPRVERTRAHQLLDIIAIALFAVLAGADGWVAIETYGIAKQPWLATFLALPNGIPSHDTFARIFARLDPAAFEASFQNWVQQIVSGLDAQVIAIDGKTLKGSYDREQRLKALQMVSAWASDHCLVLGQCPVQSKSNEITAIPVLLEQLDITGAIVTIDAMGAQKSIAQQIQQAKGDYILALKANHSKLRDSVQQWFEQHIHQFEERENWEHSDASSCESGHHRIETRRIWQVDAQQVFTSQTLAQWAGLATVVVVESERRLWNHDTHERRFFISSLSTDSASFGRHIRSHWGIENQLHWCLDVTFSEDRSRIRKDHAPQNMSVLKRLALNLLRQEKSKGSLKMKRYKAAMDNQFLLKILDDSQLLQQEI